MRVLLAEDEEDLNFIITLHSLYHHFISKSLYCNYVYRLDGEEALDALAVVDYDAII